MDAGGRQCLDDNLLLRLLHPVPPVLQQLLRNLLATAKKIPRFSRNVKECRISGNQFSALSIFSLLWTILC
jgi:hypothetical protein